MTSYKTSMLALILTMGAFSSTAALAGSSQSASDSIKFFREDAMRHGQQGMPLISGRAATEEPLPQATQRTDLERGAPGSPQYEERNELQGVDPAVRY